MGVSILHDAEALPLRQRCALTVWREPAERYASLNTTIEVCILRVLYPFFRMVLRGTNREQHAFFWDSPVLTFDTHTHFVGGPEPAKI